MLILSPLESHCRQCNAPREDCANPINENAPEGALYELDLKDQARRRRRLMPMPASASASSASEPGSGTGTMEATITTKSV